MPHRPSLVERVYLHINAAQSVRKDSDPAATLNTVDTVDSSIGVMFIACLPWAYDWPVKHNFNIYLENPLRWVLFLFSLCK